VQKKIVRALDNTLNGLADWMAPDPDKRSTPEAIITDASLQLAKVQWELVKEFTNEKYLIVELDRILANILEPWAILSALPLRILGSVDWSMINTVGCIVALATLQLEPDLYAARED